VDQVNLFKINKFEVLKLPKNSAFAHNFPLKALIPTTYSTLLSVHLRLLLL